jgi:hypothetical protein
VLFRSVEGNTLQIVAADGRVFEGDISKFTPWEQMVCCHPEGVKCLVRAARLGDMWEMNFCRRDWDTINPEYRCPVELRILWQQEE